MDLTAAKVGDVLMCEYDRGVYKKVKIVAIHGPNQWAPTNSRLTSPA